MAQTKADGQAEVASALTETGSPSVHSSTAQTRSSGDENNNSNAAAVADKPAEPEKAAAAPAGPPPPPDGGTLAWLQVAAGTCVFFSTWGLINSFGVFQSYYSTTLIPGTSDSSISWIGTLQTSLILGGSIWSGPLSDWGYGHSLIVVGSFFTVFGMFMTSLCHEYWQLVLAQGLTVGIGLGTLFTPTAGIVNTYFAKKRGLALGIVSAGSTISGVIFPVIFGNLINKIGFGWTVRVIAFILLAILAVPSVLARQRLKPPKARRIWDSKALKEPEFTTYGISLFIGYLGVYVPFFYIQLYALEERIVTGQLNFYLLTIMNAGGFFGRIVTGALADRIGAMNAYSLTTGICAVLLYGWIGIKNEAGIIVFVILYGFFSSGPILLPNTVTAACLTPDMRFFGVRLTMQLIPSAIGLLIGNPIAGAILPRGWLGLQLFAAVAVTVAAVLSYAARVLKGGANPLKKV